MSWKMRTFWLTFCVFVLVISDQINYKVNAAASSTIDSTLLSVRSCDEGIPGPVRDLVNSVDGNAATITWSPPEDASCVSGYTIIFGNESINTTDTNYTISNLLYCAVHEIQVAAVSFNDSIGDTTLTTAETFAPVPYGGVRNFKLTLIERTLNATWDPPEEAGECVGKYIIQTWDQNNSNYKEYETKELFLEFAPVVGCMTYNVQIKPWINQTTEGSSTVESLSVGDLSTNPPTNASGTSVGKTWANLMWATDSYTVNMCTINKITVQCVSEDAAAWVVLRQDLEVNITDSSNRPNIATNVTELSEFTNYSCVAVLTNSGGDSEESNPFFLQTLEEVPSAPQSLREGLKSSRGFNFSWIEPYKVPGILQNYGIVIERGNAQHFIPEGCNVEGETQFATSVDTDINEFEYEEGVPYYLYTVRVNASTRVGDGPAAEIDIITASDVPERPRNLSYSLDIAQSTDYLVNVSVTWLLPCNTNGELDHFEITITGSPTFEEIENPTLIKAAIDKNSDIEDISYEYLIEHINASYSYNITVNAVLIEEIEGETEVIDFISPDGYPGEPTLDPIEDSGSDYFYITWSEPNIKNGELRNYSIKIESHGPLYPVVDLCEIDTQTYSYSRSPDATSFNFTEAKPAYNYSVVIAAATSVGYGSDSNEEFVYTGAAKPDPPVITNHYFEQHDLTEYNVTGFIEWSAPCESNGFLSHFRVLIDGFSTYDNGTDSDVIQVENEGTFNFIYARSVKAAYNYTIQVITVLNDTTLESDSDSELTFVTPDGYPGKPILNEVVDIGSTYFYFTWTEPVTKNGKLQNYSIAIQSFGPLYAFDSEACEVDTALYTEIWPAEATEFNFTQAKPYHNYTITVSAATSVGYGIASDSEIVYSEQAQPEPPENLATSYEEYDLTNYNVSSTINWTIPCEINGVLDHFKLIIDGYSTYNDGTDREELELSVDNREDFSFSVLRSIKAAYNYTFIVTNILNNSLESVSSEITLLAPDGYPGKPILNEVVDIGSTYFYFTWTEPVTKNGKLQNYSIAIQSFGPLYAFDSEACEVDTALYTEIWPAEATEFNFTQAKPYHNYTIAVSAATSVGYGIASDSEIVYSEQAQPEPPENLATSYEEYDLTNYNVSSTINWTIPCEINGVLDHFKLIIDGYSTYNDGTDREELELSVDNREDFSFSVLRSLKAAYNYTFVVTNILNNSLESVSSEITLLAPDGYPAAPLLNEPFNSTSDSFGISWSEPDVTNGRLIAYTLTVVRHGASYSVPDDCPLEETTPKVFEISADENYYRFTEAMPYHIYSVSVKANTSRGFGVESNERDITTERIASNPVTSLDHTVEYGDSLQYESKLTITFERPCHTYGTLIGYTVVLYGERDGKEPHEVTEETNLTTYTTTSLKPDYVYTVNVSVITESDFRSEPANLTFVTQAGVPLGVTTEELQSPNVEGAYTATYTFHENLFDDTNGDIIYYAIILGVYGFHEESKASTWRGTEDSWPLVSSTNATDDTMPYQATPNFWNPFQENGNSTVTFRIGEGNCTTVYESCNDALKPNTEYAFKIRAFTRHGYRDSPTVTFITEKLSSATLPVILGSVFGIIAAFVLAVFIFILWRRKRKWFEKKETVTEISNTPNPIPVKEFPNYYSNLMLNYNQLKAEYTLLESKTRDIDKAITVADLPEHKGKNRYCNIKPFDETRVILKTDANANYSDYINASYVKGFFGNIDYIATQGPLEATCLDFWRMVLQENATVIAMVAQCMEQNREKCYQYFPAKHETIEIGDGIEIRCTTELNFGSYIIKNLLVQKDVEKHTLTHLQFVDWPDFGCPSDTSHLLEFCQTMRNSHKREGGKIVVHCSAGVGRSGTLIAIDMLLQGIQANRDVDIFGTVLNLREQRPKMVQTEKQYAYIHRCVNDFILNPSKYQEQSRPSEVIYENVELLKESGSSQEKLIKESAF